MNRICQLQHPTHFVKFIYKELFRAASRGMLQRPHVPVWSTLTLQHWHGTQNVFQGAIFSRLEMGWFQELKAEGLSYRFHKGSLAFLWNECRWTSESNRLAPARYCSIGGKGVVWQYRFVGRLNKNTCTQGLDFFWRESHEHLGEWRREQIFWGIPPLPN